MFKYLNGRKRKGKQRKGREEKERNGARHTSTLTAMNTEQICAERNPEFN